MTSVSQASVATIVTSNCRRRRHRLLQGDLGMRNTKIATVAWRQDSGGRGRSRSAVDSRTRRAADLKILPGVCHEEVWWVRRFAGVSLES